MEKSEVFFKFQVLVVLRDVGVDLGDIAAHRRLLRGRVVWGLAQQNVVAFAFIALCFALFEQSLVVASGERGLQQLAVDSALRLDQ